MDLFPVNGPLCRWNLDLVSKPVHLGFELQWVKHNLKHSSPIRLNDNLSLQPQKTTKATSRLSGQRLLIPSPSLSSILHSESEKEKLLFLLGGAPGEERASGRDKRRVWGENEEVVERKDGAEVFSVRAFATLYFSSS